MRAAGHHAWLCGAQAGPASWLLSTRLSDRPSSHGECWGRQTGKQTSKVVGVGERQLLQGSCIPGRTATLGFWKEVPSVTPKEEAAVGRARRVS